MCKYKCTRLIFRGVPDERPISDLPIERPDFKLLYGVDETPGKLAHTMEEAEVAAPRSITKRTTRGGEDIDVTDKLTMTWVSALRCERVGYTEQSAGPIDIIRYT
jgi:hypothetical protein